MRRGDSKIREPDIFASDRPGTNRKDDDMMREDLAGGREAAVSSSEPSHQGLETEERRQRGDRLKFLGQTSKTR